MRIFAEKLIAPAVLLAATSIGTWLEVPFGGFGISIEHILLMVYFITLLFRKFGRSEFEFGFAAVVTTCTGMLGAVTIQLANAHLLSLVVLSLMFPLFINFFKNEANPQRLVTVAFVLIVIQCIFFSHGALEYNTDWDTLAVLDFGVIQRLAVLGFVSNSLGLMLFPIFIYFLHLAQTRQEGRALNFLLCLASIGFIGATFSRTALFLVLLSFIFMLNTKRLIALLSLCILLIVNDPYELIRSLISAIDREQDLLDNPRIAVWFIAISDWGGSALLIGRGLQNPPLDNTYLSIVTGAGVLGILALFFFMLALVRWLFRMRKKLPPADFRPLAIVVGSLLIGANTYDLFSQRKILFGAAIVIGALLCNAKNLHIRR